MNFRRFRKFVLPLFIEMMVDYCLLKHFKDVDEEQYKESVECYVNHHNQLFRSDLLNWNPYKKLSKLFFNRLKLDDAERVLPFVQHRLSEKGIQKERIIELCQMLSNDLDNILSLLSCGSARKGTLFEGLHETPQHEQMYDQMYITLEELVYFTDEIEINEETTREFSEGKHYLDRFFSLAIMCADNKLESPNFHTFVWETARLLQAFKSAKIKNKRGWWTHFFFNYWDVRETKFWCIFFDDRYEVGNSVLNAKAHLKLVDNFHKIVDVICDDNKNVFDLIEDILGIEFPFETREHYFNGILSQHKQIWAKKVFGNWDKENGICLDVSYKDIDLENEGIEYVSPLPRFRPVR